MTFTSDLDLKRASLRTDWTEDHNRFSKQHDLDSENPCDDDFQLQRNFDTDFPPLEKSSLKSESEYIQTPIRPFKTKEGKSTHGGNTMNNTFMHSIDESNPPSRNDESIDKRIFESLLSPSDQPFSRFGFAHEEKESDYGDEDLSNIIKESFNDFSKDTSNALETSYTTPTPSNTETRTSRTTY